MGSNISLIMKFEELVYHRRTIRRFTQEKISTDILRKLVDFGRVAPVAMNVQALEFVIINNPKKCNEIFPHLRWAGALPPELRTPEDGRMPTAYIIILINTATKKNAALDVGAAVENILLGAANFGIGTCWMGAIDRKKIAKILKLPKQYEISHLISLGYPDEESYMEIYDGSYKYWMDEEGKMHVPKRTLEDVIFKIEE